MADDQPEQGMGNVYDPGSDDEEDELFVDLDNDPNVVRVGEVLEGQDDESDDEDMDMQAGSSRGPNGEYDDPKGGSGFALKADGYGDERDEEEGDPDEEVVDMSTGRLEGHTDSIYAVAVNPQNPQMVATGSGDDSASLFNGDSGSRISLTGHTDTVVDVAFNTAGTMLATAGMDSVVKIWNSADGTLLQTLEGPGEDILWLSWHSKGDVILAGSSDMSTWMWNAATGSCMAVLSGHNAPVNCGMFTDNGKMIVTASSDTGCRVWNPKDGSCVISLLDAKGAGTFHQAGVNCLDTKGGLILTGSEDCAAILTALTVPEQADILPTAKVLMIYKHHEQSVESVGIAPNMQYLATGGLDSKIFIYEIGKENPRCTCHHEAGITKMKWHPTKEWLISGSLDRTVRVWDARTGAGMVTWTGHQDAVMDIAPSPDGKYVISGGDDPFVLLWNFPTA
mmetsp:Transcript_16273/g.25273  ORF Transcript_16273/g.25273 Transcript_16273/m.25273 type:complete len:451 (-) Transcript_16273:108-1460(-)|eukprot:CAMPEP_0184294068 /NCGR_PEP_ID=MMETSP1049-20130417/5345_1 /TAXON_ID=77928 /ORGANISM="Proteomonas sulcata, Strain CCMP704" /LENGTH=450 /DNA_ID=CAMNT_0026602229 /DNA_START=111 /DNA_END=1463 /DNA_ORIENTATION=-